MSTGGGNMSDMSYSDSLSESESESSMSSSGSDFTVGDSPGSSVTDLLHASSSPSSSNSRTSTESGTTRGTPQSPPRPIPEWHIGVEVVSQQLRPQYLPKPRGLRARYSQYLDTKWLRKHRRFRVTAPLKSKSYTAQEVGEILERDAEAKAAVEQCVKQQLAAAVPIPPTTAREQGRRVRVRRPQPQLTPAPPKDANKNMMPVPDPKPPVPIGELVERLYEAPLRTRKIKTEKLNKKYAGHRPRPPTPGTTVEQFVNRMFTLPLKERVAADGKLLQKYPPPTPHPTTATCLEEIVDRLYDGPLLDAGRHFAYLRKMYLRPLTPREKRHTPQAQEEANLRLYTNVVNQSKAKMSEMCERLQREWDAKKIHKNVKVGKEHIEQLVTILQGHRSGGYARGLCEKRTPQSQV